MAVNKKMLAAAAAFAAVQMGITGCFAAIEFKPGNGGYMLCGEGEKYNGNFLSLFVEHEEGGSTVTDHVSYITTDGDGNFSYSFKLKSDAPSVDNYTVRVSAVDKGEIYTTTFAHADTAKKLEIIGCLNGGKEPAEALSEAVKYSMLSYPGGRRDDFPPSYNAKMKELVYSQIAEHGFTAENYSQKMNEIYAVTALAFADGGSIAQVIESNADYLGFNTLGDYYSYYEKKSSGVNAIILKNEFKNKDGAQKIFKEAVVLDKINNTQSPSDIADIIEQNSEFFDAKVTTLDRNGKILLAGKIIDAKEKNSKKLEKISDTLSYVPYNDEENPGGSTSSSGGSSRGSGSSGPNITLVPNGEEQSSETNIISFADINEAKWAREAIESLVAKKVINGYDDGDFKPNNNITREEFVKIVVGAFGIEVLPSESVFDDVAADCWAKDYIAAARKNNIVNGITDTLFGLGNNITRQDMAVMLVNAYEAKFGALEEKDASFADGENIAGYAKSPVAKLCGAGVVSGYEDGTFLPANNATRAEAAQMVYRILKVGELNK